MMWHHGVLAGLAISLPLYGWWRQEPILDHLRRGVVDSFGIIKRIIPLVFAMLVAISMLRASGFFELLAGGLSSVLVRVGLPT